MALQAVRIRAKPIRPQAVRASGGRGAKGANRPVERFQSGSTAGFQASYGDAVVLRRCGARASDLMQRALRGAREGKSALAHISSAELPELQRNLAAKPD